MIIVFILLCIILSELTYSVSARRQLGFNPYPFATPELCILIDLSVLANSILYCGWILGIIISCVTSFSLWHITLGWPLSFVPNLFIKDDQKFIEFSYFELVMLIPALLISIIFFIISLFTVEFSCLLSYITHDPDSVIIFLLVAVGMSLIRHILFKVTTPTVISRLESSLSQMQNDSTFEDSFTKEKSHENDDEEDFIEITNFSEKVDMCRDVIKKCESELPEEYVSAKYVIVDKFYDYLYANREDPLEEDEIYFAILSICFDLISSGDFHKSLGELDEDSEAPALCLVFDNCISWLKENEHMTEEDYNDICSELQQNINSRG